MHKCPECKQDHHIPGICFLCKEKVGLPITFADYGDTIILRGIEKSKYEVSNSVHNCHIGIRLKLDPPE